MLYPLSYEGGGGKATEAVRWSARRLGDGVEGAWVAPVELVERRGRGVVRRHPDDEVLFVAVGELQHLGRQPQRTDLGMVERRLRRAPRRIGVAVPAVGERRAGRYRELGDESIQRRIGAARTGAKGAGVLVGNGVPVRERRRGASVGEGVADEVRLVAIEEAHRSGDALEGGVPGEHVGEPVDDERSSRLERVEDLAHVLTHLPRQRTVTRTQLAAVAHRSEQAEVAAILLVETKRIGDGGEHLGRRMAVASLFQSHEVVDADAGERRQLGPTQARSTTAGPVRQADRGWCHRLPPTAQETTEVAIPHDRQSASTGAQLRGPDRASIAAAFPSRRRWPHRGRMTNMLTTPLPLIAGHWPLDAAHSRIGFAIRHLGVAKVRGLFREFDATLKVGETFDDTSISATVALASIDTANADRDAHVRSPELLDVEQRPHMSFVSQTISGAGSDWSLLGDLTIGDVTRPVQFAVEFGGVADFVDGTRHAGFEVTGELRRKDFGLGFGPLGSFLGDVVKIDLDFEFVEPQ
jgi:polyisoprenoid-binding protein YceI